LIKVARVKYAGNWNPEPMSWTRFARHFQRETDVMVDVSTTDWDKLDTAKVDVAVLTGTAAYTPTQAETDAMVKFVDAGGVLLIDPCGGSGDFGESVRIMLGRAFPSAPMQLLPRDHPIVRESGPGMDDLTTPALRAYTRQRTSNHPGRLEILKSGKGRVIYSPLDFTTGLLGANTWGIFGFEPVYAEALVKNILLWSATGMKE
jgi:hypothetical protein